MRDFNKVTLVERALCVVVGVLTIVETACKKMFGPLWVEAEKRAAERRG